MTYAEAVTEAHRIIALRRQTIFLSAHLIDVIAALVKGPDLIDQLPPKEAA